jgi:hypothetical protein
MLCARRCFPFIGLLILSLVLVGGSQAATWNVPGNFATIQAAIDGAAAGDVINVAAGHYEEQLHITKSNLSISGAGVGQTFIDSPASLALSYTTSEPNFPIVFVQDCAGLLLSNATVDGLGRGNANYRFQGVAFFNAGGTLSAVEVNNVMDTPFSGAQHGVGIYAYADNLLPHAITLTQVTVNGFQKTGIAIAGDGVIATLNTVAAHGQGPTSVTAQNGIQGGYGASVSATNCTVTGIDFTGDGWAASGYLGYQADSFDMTDCTADGCMVSLYMQDSSGSFNGGSVVNPTYDGLYVKETGAGPAPQSGKLPLPAQFLAEDLQYQRRGTVSFTVDGSSFVGANLVDTWGLAAFGYGTVGLTVSNCLISHWDYGVVAYDYGGASITTTVNNNQLLDNLTFGMYANTPNTQNAERNWWGDPDPSDQVGDPGKVDFSPWWNAVPGTSPMPLGTNDSIQAAINLATPGATISVAAGSYEEQLNIAKDLFIEGASEALTTVVSPTALPLFFTSGGDNYPVVYIHDAEVHLSDLTVDGAGRGNGNYGFVGVAFWNAGGSLTDITVTGVRETPISGAQHGLAVFADNNTGGPYDIDCTDLTALDYQKNGVTLLGVGLSTDLLRVSCTGAGATSIIAQNGIELGQGAAATLTDCATSGHHWLGADWTSTGLLLVDASPVVATNFDSSEDQVCVYAYDSDLNLDGATLLHTSSDPAYDGVTMWSSSDYPGPGQPRVRPQPLSELAAGGDRAAMAVTIANSTITGQDRPGSWGLDAYAEADPITLNVDGCTITGFETGAWMEEAGSILLADLTGNSIYDNGDGVWSNTATPVDARNCWWGHHTGPFHATLNTAGQGNAVSDNVLFDPWTGMAALSFDPAASGPITCSQTSLLTVHYAPDGSTPALRGYEITLDPSPELSFGEGDITDLYALDGLGEGQYFDVVDNGNGTITIAAAILGATAGLTAAADLFTVNVHGAQTGTGSLVISEYKLRDLDNDDFYATLAGATVDVDCTPPDVPTLDAEPAFTQGTENFLSWNDMAGSGATAYLIERAEDAAFTLGLADSGWIPGTSHTFTGLTDGQIYYYRVKTQDALLNESAWSGTEFSTQDDTAPATSVDALAIYQGAASWNVAYTASDATSGVASVELYYQLDGGLWQPLGVVGASPVAFNAPDGDGLYGFYTVGTDAVGNVEGAPGTADAETTLDTTPPAGSFFVNSDAAYTNSLTVTLNSGVSDLHPPLDMRFSNDGLAFDPWLPYAVTSPWTLLAGADGPRTVWAEYRDVVGNVYAIQDAIVYDATAPGGISGLALATGHEEVTVTWNDPVDADLAMLEVYRGVWHDGAYLSAYPEYDDIEFNKMPDRPADRAAAYASPEWELAGTAMPGDEQFVDTGAPRGVYVYQVFTVDVALNYGPAQGGADYVPTDGKANYWLGDVDDYGTGDGFYDGFVNIGDITVMAATFGLCDGAGDYNNEVDVGPTSDNSPLGIPTTDSCIDFEDLIIIAINYDMVAPLAAPPAGVGDPVFTWYRIDESTWGFGLLAAGAGLQGLRISAALPAGVTPVVAAGQALQQQGPYFFANIDANGFDANLALLGTGRAFTAAGELLRVTLPMGVEPGELAISARSTANAELAFSLDDTAIPELPAVYRVAQNFPNPFNPKTAIRFDLPEAQVAQVAVFGADGRLVRLLLDELRPAGFHQVVWDGTDSAGEQVASGVYFYSIQAGPLNETRKMLLLK